jgi:hypothetical protein
VTTQSPPPRSGAQSPTPEENPADAESASQAFGDATRRIAEIREYILYYLAVQADSARLAARKAIFLVVLGILGLLTAGSAVVVAVVLLMSGIAGGIGEALGKRFWLGDVIVGIVFLGALAIAGKFGLSMMTGSSRKTTVQKYELRKHEQRVQFGHDVKQRARDQQA